MYLSERPRRLRRNDTLRRMVRETRLSVDNLVLPLFVRDEAHACKPISSMPGQFQWGIAEVADQAAKAADAGIPAVLLFGIPASKDAEGSSAWEEGAVVCRAVEAIKKRCPSQCVITDVCLCEYTDHGHCGILCQNRDGIMDVSNDATVEVLVKEALAHANAGADMVAPSDMMDGRIGEIRRALEAHGFVHTKIMSYAAKYASHFYGPFRDAVGSAENLGKADKKTYQMDPANVNEALHEVGLDLAEGADMVMVKPGLPYLDVIRTVKDTFKAPTFAYQVSGEYAMLCAAAQNGWLDLDTCMLEALMSFKRAGADGILTYFALEAATLLKK